MSDVPAVRQVVLDGEDIRTLAEFYRGLLGMEYWHGHETPVEGEDWLNLVGPVNLAFQKVDRLERATWPDDEVPQQLHLDMTVPDGEALERQRDRVLALGGRLIHDRADDPDEQLYVFADPAGHPFCIIVAPELYRT
jgi:catechol 2,3-dioxygenase-like lactoylglutathione lyase family enzyme